MISEVSAADRYTANGSTTVFAYTFKIYANTEVEVLIDDTVKTLSTHYTVDGLGVSGGGNVTFLATPAADAIVTILRKQPAAQASDYVPNEAFPSARIEKDLDKVTMMIQQLKEEVDRALKFVKSSALVDQDVEAPTEGAFARGKVGGGVDWATVVTDGEISLPLVVASGGTGSSSASAARTALGVPAATSGTLTQPTLLSPIVTGIQGGTAIQRKRKTADESLNTSTTLQDDNHLVLAVDGLEEWVGEIHLAVGAALGDTGIKVAITVPSGATLQVTAIIAGDVLAKSVGLTTTTSGQQLDGTTTILAGCVNGVVTMHFWILNGATPGNLQLQWAQSTSHGSNVTVRKGSVLFAQRVA